MSGRAPNPPGDFVAYLFLYGYCSPIYVVFAPLRAADLNNDAGLTI